MWQKLKCIPTPILLLSVALGAASNADWLREAKYGAFMHLLPSDAKTLAMVDDFDVEQLAGQLESIGAKYFVLTLGQNSGYFNAPNVVYDRTTGPVVFTVEPPEASVSEGGKTLGRTSTFGAASPLQLRGPMVHDLTLSAPGRKGKMVRILVSGNAGRERAVVKEKLKPE